MSDGAKIVADLTSWHWWLMVFVAGVAASLLSRAVEKPLDAVWAAWSDRRRATVASGRAALAAEGLRLAESAQLLALEIRAESLSMRLGILLIGVAFASMMIALFGMQLREAPQGTVRDLMGARPLVVTSLLSCAMFFVSALYMLRRALRHTARIEAAQDYLRRAPV
jgi:hypothetical protein